MREVMMLSLCQNEAVYNVPPIAHGNAAGLITNDSSEPITRNNEARPL